MQYREWVSTPLQPVVHYANCLVCRPSESFGPRTVGDYQWIYVKKGKGKARIGNESFRAYAGCLFMYGPGEPHWFESSEEEPFILYGLHFAFVGDLLQVDKDVVISKIEGVNWDEFDTFEPDPERVFPRRLQTGTWLLPYFEQIVDEYRSDKPMNELILRGLLTLLVVKLFRWASDEHSIGSTLDKQIDQVKEKLTELGGQSYDPTWITQWMPYSHDYVSRLFKARFGIAVHTFHDQVKLTEAKRMLVETDLTSTSIAETMQFGSVHYFCKWFKLRTGNQPQEYRSRKRFL